MTWFDIMALMEAPLSARCAVLQALATPAYGLEIVDRVRNATGGQMSLRSGSLYPALRKLESEGLLRSRQVSSPRNRVGRPRRYYELTRRGVLAAMLQRERLAAFFRSGSAGAPPPDRTLARQRLRSCARVSAFALALRRQTRLAKGSPD